MSTSEGEVKLEAKSEATPEPKSEAKHEPAVRFSKGMALAGVVGGVVIAVGLPALLILFGQFLGVVVITILSVLALITGGGLAVVSAFFGTVMPSRAG